MAARSVQAIRGLTLRSPLLSSRHHRSGIEIGNRRGDAFEIGVENGNAARIGRIQRADDDYRIEQAKEHPIAIILETRLEPVLADAILAQTVGLMLQKAPLNRPATLGAHIARQKVGEIESARAAAAPLPVHRSECRRALPGAVEEQIVCTIIAMHERVWPFDKAVQHA